MVVSDNSLVSLVLRPRRRQNRQEGFTLIEVMIAMLLLLVGVAGVLSLQMISVRATSFSRHATEATIVAEDKMEDLMTLSTTSPLFVTGTDLVDGQGVANVAGATHPIHKVPVEPA